MVDKKKGTVMSYDEGWGDDLTHIGLESFTSGSNDRPPPDPNFKTINIVVENGIYYVNVYIHYDEKDKVNNQRFLIWLDSLKQTDYVKLTVSSMICNVPVNYYFTMMAAILRCKATIEIQLDTIVCDNIAYLYLAAPKVNVGAMGALFIPSYTDTPSSTKSDTWLVVYDFITDIIDKAEIRGILTVEECEKLHDGKSISVPLDRFKSTQLS